MDKCLFIKGKLHRRAFPKCRQMFHVFLSFGFVFYYSGEEKRSEKIQQQWFYGNQKMGIIMIVCACVFLLDHSQHSFSFFLVPITFLFQILQKELSFFHFIIQMHVIFLGENAFFDISQKWERYGRGNFSLTVGFICSLFDQWLSRSIWSLVLWCLEKFFWLSVFLFVVKWL